MKKAIRLTLLLTMSVAMAMGGSIMVDFSIFGVPDINNPGLLGPENITSTPSITRTATTTGVTFQYDVDPNALLSLPGNLGACGFDAGLGGLQWTPGCVGAHVDSAGVYGTTDGTYDLSFGPAGASALDFSFFVGSDVDFGLSALFFMDGVLRGASALDATSPSVACAGGFCSGAFSYTGPGFNLVLLNYGPTGQLIPDPNGGPDPIGATYGQTLLTMDTMSYDPTPEPATLALCAGALMGLGALRRLIRKRS